MQINNDINFTIAKMAACGKDQKARSTASFAEVSEAPLSIATNKLICSCAVSTSAPGGPDAKMFSDCNSAPAVQSIPRKPVRSSTTRPTSPAAKDFDQILGGMHRERSSSEAGLNANGAATAGAAMLDSAIKRSASVVRLIFDA